jgi:hypothetical protein
MEGMMFIHKNWRLGLIIPALVLSLAGCAMPIPTTGEVKLKLWPDKATLPPGECTTLHWYVLADGEAPAFLDGEAVSQDGQKQVCPGETRDYELKAQSGVRSFSQKITITISAAAAEQDKGQEQAQAKEQPKNPQEGQAQPQESAAGEARLDFSAEPSHIAPGECALLSWQLQAEGEARVTLDEQEVGRSGERKVCPETTTTYNLAVGMASGLKQKAVTVVVAGTGEEKENPPPSKASPPPPPPPPAQPGAPSLPPNVAINFRADQTSLTAGQCTELRWDVEGVKSVTLDGGGVVGHDHKQVCPAATTTYTLHVVWNGGATDRMVTIAVTSGGSKAGGGNGGLSADLRVTDLFPKSAPKGEVYARVTNNGPGTLNNAQAALECNQQGSPVAAGAKLSANNSPPIITIQLAPGQTKEFYTSMSLDTDSYDYQMSCRVVPSGGSYSDPNTNDYYKEHFAASSKAANPGAPPGNNGWLGPATIPTADIEIESLESYGGIFVANVVNHGPDDMSLTTLGLDCSMVLTNKNSHVQFPLKEPTMYENGPRVPFTLEWKTNIPFQSNSYVYDITCNVDGNYSDPDRENNTCRALFNQDNEQIENCIN